MACGIVYLRKWPFNWLSYDVRGCNFGSSVTLYSIRAFKILQGVGRVQVYFNCNRTYQNSYFEQ